MNVKALFSCGTGILPVPDQTGETPVPQEVYLQNWDAPFLSHKGCNGIWIANSVHWPGSDTKLFLFCLHEANVRANSAYLDVALTFF